MKTISMLFLVTAAAFGQSAFQVEVRGKGPALILIPGLSSSGEVWADTVKHYEAKFECHVLTLAGFAGVPALPGATLESTRDELASYVRTQKLNQPSIVGHSLGGFLALSFASKYPQLAGKLVIVDSYPFLGGIMSADATAESAKEQAQMMRKMIADQPQESYERYVKSGIGTRDMVASKDRLERITAWGMQSDKRTVGNHMAELYGTDLRAAIATIESPTLVMGTWIGYKQYTTRERTLENLRGQYRQLKQVRIELSDTARHFVMWDDPEWMFGKMDEFLAANGKTRTE